MRRRRRKAQEQETDDSREAVAACAPQQTDTIGPKCRLCSLSSLDQFFVEYL